MKISFLGLLTILFIALKLCGVIAWSWWLVLLPMYLGLAIIVGLLILALLGAVGVGTISWILDTFKSPRKFGK